ncbi:MAG: LTA synthase family protein [Alphaproteobacteria bacterium]|nr:LTA synthase family protein [Alphaproteobacteria bacterium]
MKMLGRFFEVIVAILLAVVTIVLSVLIYVKRLWPNADYEQIMNTLKDISLNVIVDNAYPMDYFWGFLFVVIVFPILYFYLGVKKQLGVLVLFSFIVAYYSGFIHYEIYSRTVSNLFENEYLNPNEIEYKFPEKKKNLLLIYVESLEQNFSNEKVYEKNLIPNLIKLQNEGEYSLEHRSLPGSDYSIAALVASKCAVPLRFNRQRDMWEAKFFLPNLKCFPEVLKDNGYQVKIIKAADIGFTNVDLFAKQHGFDEGIGVNEIKKDIGDENWEDKLGTFGGVSDRVLFEYAKSKIEKFDKDKPFMLTLFSLDTHTPAPFLDKKCKKEFDDTRDSFACTDKAVVEFIDWFKKTKYWDDTLVVVVGDHLLPSRMKGQEKDRKRGIYNVFLNVPEGLKIDKNKIFSTYDFAPTILDGLGVEMKPRGFGLGRSMFSDELSLMEKLGETQFKVRLIQKSKVYDDFLIPKVERVEVFEKYKIGEEIKGKEFLGYTDSSLETLGRYYIDRLGIEIDGYNGGDLEAVLKFYAIMGYNSKVVVSADDKDIAEFLFDRKVRQPYVMSFKIGRDVVKDGKVVLKIRNTSGVQKVHTMGISPDSLVIKEISK